MREKDLEDFICRYPEVLARNRGVEDIKIIGRQLSVPNGRLDILCTRNDCQILVIELKIGNLDETNLGQVLRYTTDIRRALFGVEVRRHIENDFIWTRATNEVVARISAYHGMGGLQTVFMPPVVPVLIGQSASSRLLIAAEGCLAEVYQYHLYPQDNTLAITELIDESDTDWDSRFNTSGDNVEIQVHGDGDNVDWLCVCEFTDLS